MLMTENSVELRDVDIIKEWNDLKKLLIGSYYGL